MKQSDIKKIARRRLIPADTSDFLLSPEQMNMLSGRFQTRAEEARHPGRRLARTRIRLVFLLIRYSGLRLGEALGLDDTRDIRLADACLEVGGAHARTLPMPLPLLVHMQRALEEPAALSVRGKLVRLDQGYVRRTFYACAEECGIAPERASPRNIRLSRAAELLRKGLPQPVVEHFLGSERAGGFVPYSGEESTRLLRDCLHRESVAKTSARNVFSGCVVSVRQHDFLAEVIIRTLTGLEIAAVITEESLKNLELFEGKPIVATVKAPWVMLRRDVDLAVSACNRFPGKVIGVRRSDAAAEVVAELFDGSRVCAVVLEDVEDLAGVEPGDMLQVSFKAFAVVLTAVQS